MSPRRHAPPRESAGRRAVPLALPFLLAALAAGCGKKLAPEAPLQVIPARVEPLEAYQEGTDVVLRFPYPSRTIQGESLTDLTRVTIYRELSASRPGAKAPPPPQDAARAREERLFQTRAEVAMVLSRSELDETTIGGEIVVRDSLLPLIEQKRLGNVLLRYGVTATRERKKVSELSPLTGVVPIIPPEEPRGLAAAVEEKRVCLEWLPPRAMLDGAHPPVVRAYAVYRREAKDEEYDVPVGIARGTVFVDEEAASGKKYLYTVRASPVSEKPLPLGPPADEVLVDTVDVFSPPAPDGFLALREEGATRLVWNPVLVPDLAGYRVYRRARPDAAWVLVADKVADTSAVDRGAPAGAVYAVSAVDRSGNEGPKVEEAR